MTVGIYIRVSTEEQAKEGYSIPAQREKLIAFCQSQGWDDYKFYVDEGESAKDTNRTYLNLMRQHIAKGMINTVLVYRLDRLTRSVRDLYALLDEFEKYNCTFRSATEIYDTSTAIGRLFITLVAALAQWERENLGERVRMGQIEKARQGLYSAKAPFGFDKTNDDKLIINDDEKQVILDMIRKLEEGYSIRQLTDYMNKESGIPPIRGYKWHVRTILDILHNPAIHGATKWRDEIIENTHEGILSKNDHDKLLKLLNDRQNKKKRKVNSIFVFQMKLVCPTCGNHLTSERKTYTRKKDGHTTEFNQYRCQVCALNKRKPTSISEKKIEKALLNYMQNFEFGEPDLEPVQDDETAYLLKRLDQIKKQRAKYQKAWSNDLMTDEEFNARMEETRSAMSNIEEQLGKEKIIERPTLDKSQIKEIVNNFNLNWTHLTQKEKHQFLNMFVKEIHFYKDDGEAVITDIIFY
jgi:DNA invertase Pin-like site-specific DNA recombinase